jgi:hypothetical protein
MKSHCENWLLSGMAMFLTVIMTACSGGNGADSAGNGSVSGVVSDIATGAPLAGVAVSDGTSSATTDAGGAFKLARPVGNYTLSASKDGYEVTYRVCSVTSNATTTLNWALTKAHGAYVDYTNLPPSQMIPAAARNDKYTILAWNDLGMHCAQDDYSYFLILPPFNTLHVQVIERGVGVVTSGITVSYAFPKKTDSTLYTNFWTYAAKYGFKVAPNVGITGTPLAGNMVVDQNVLGFVATGIPVTPYDDDGTWDPYGVAVVTVNDGAVTQTANVVVPISTELNCGNCHGTANTFLNILQMHDKHNNTTLVADQAAGKPHMCAECHSDNALGAAGKKGVTNLSLAIHGFHKDKMNVSADPGTPACYNCHPGPKTKCLRGLMAHAGKSCMDCHGDMYAMTAALANGRQPWLQEPRCGDCHGTKHQENSNTLYRNSVLKNTPDPKMSGQLYCAGCHNSPHGEYTSTNLVDHSIPQKFQGDNYWIWNCYVCHNDYMPSPATHM